MGGGPEKLLTLEEAAQRLGVPADDVEALVRAGRLTAFRLGGSLLRLRLQEVEALGKERLRITSRPSLPASSRWERLVDFLHFNDFYLVAFLIILTLLAIIFAL